MLRKWRHKRAEILRPCNGGDSTSQEKFHEAEQEHKRTKRPADYREEERTRILENRGMNGFLDRLNPGEVWKLIMSIFTMMLLSHCCYCRRVYSTIFLHSSSWCVTFRFGSSTIFSSSSSLQVNICDCVIDCVIVMHALFYSLGVSTFRVIIEGIIKIFFTAARF